MDEKIIIKSKRESIALITVIILLIGVVIFSYVWNSYVLNIPFYAEKVYLGDWSYVYFSMVPYFGAMTLLPFIIIAALFFFWASKSSMTITTKRVYGKSVFGKRVDLPIDSISAIGTGLFKSIAVATSSGKISFPMIKNRDEIHKALSDLLIARQEKPTAATTIKQEIPQSNADELKKYKDLLDSGIISQAEFDAKKKQLLGL